MPRSEGDGADEEAYPPLVRMALVPAELERVVRLLRERPPSVAPSTPPAALAPEGDDGFFVMTSLLWEKK